MKLFVPGRICLFGEHSDWAGAARLRNSKLEKGYTIISGTNQGIYAEAEPHPNLLILKSKLPDGEIVGPFEIPMERKSLLEVAEKGGFFSYAAGVAYQLLTHYHVKGLNIFNYKMDLPLKKGLSSSAAICVLVARAFNRLYDLKMTTRGEMEAAYHGELLTPSRCGRMDQGCAFGVRPILMIHDSDLLTVEELDIGGAFYYVIVDLRAGKNTQEILTKLNQHFPFASDRLGKRVQRYLGKINKEINFKAIAAIQTGDAQKLGKLMNEAQAKFDKYLMPACPSQLTAPVLHKVLNYEPIQPYIYGAKGVGSQGDGTAQLLAKDKASQQKVIEILESQLNVKCLTFDLEPPKTVRKAVITAAGFGSLLFPASKAMKKELFPIIDRDGIAKPIILAIVEEALSAGIEQIGIIIENEDKHIFDAFFNQPLSPYHYNKLPNKAREYVRYLENIGRRVHFITQESQEGFGHAVMCARKWVGQEPFLLLLGDHLYRSDTEESCAKQVLDLYHKYQTSIVGLKRTPEYLISQYGAVTGTWVDEEELIDITQFVEKPTIDYAKNNLRTERLASDEYLTVFGMYVLLPDIFEYLDDLITCNIRQDGEFQLTPALDKLRQSHGFLGAIIQGQRFNTGSPQAFMTTFSEFAEK
ncbi:GHMP kinase [candidate division KSB1 bacterium]|nr:GHMP kinase [candidate division KSB1 bacterium]